MAKLILLLLLLITITATISAAASTEQPYRLLQSQKPAPAHRREKLSHLRFYWHDIYSGRNPTAVSVARAASTNSSATGFGLVSVIDDALTVGPDLKSQLVGRSQGMYASASQEGVALIMAMNFAFVDGKYNGSSITVLGRNPVLSEVREMPIVGGSGLFRFARGYVQARTHLPYLKNGDATVEYNVFVLHY